MAEVTREARPVQIDCLCDKCGKGYMRRDHSAAQLMSKPPQIWHECAACGYRSTYRTVYPRIVYAAPGQLVELSPAEQLQQGAI